MTSFPEDRIQFWEDRYLQDAAGWDLGGPTPVFDSIADELNPGKLCIIGCGRGHDAVMFARKGFKVTAVDFSPSAIQSVKDLAAKSDVPIQTVHSDIFLLNSKFTNVFDYVVEQTCFCAINPAHRIKYETLVKRLLISGGLLIGLIETMWSGYVSIEYKDVAAFSVLIIVLIFFPTGFLGKPDIEKV